MTNIIGDIAGEYKALIALVNQMPDGEVISVGDMVDRGPDSKRVIEYFMKEGRRAILGNHEHMMIDYLTQGRFYGRGIWMMNGGGHTLTSYDEFREKQNPVPQEHIDWITGLPKYIEIDDVLISHSFLRNIVHEDPLEYCCDFGDSIYDKDETTIIWNRSQPVPQDRWRLQVVGHNSQFGLYEWKDDEGNLYAICLDDCRKRVLTGFHLETMTIYQQPFIDEVSSYPKE